MRRHRIAVLVSGRGSNLQALIDACRAPDYPATIVLVVSNRPGAQALERAREADIAALAIDHGDYDDRESFEREVDKAVRKAGAELVCLAGFMRVLTPYFVSRWRNRLINIHPSLLPLFKGLHTHERALETGVRFSGCTVHFVRPDMDSGPIILQAVVAVSGSDTADSLAARILVMEHRIYPMAVRLIAESRVRVVGEKVEILETGSPDGGLINPIPPDPA